ncbi:MAG TPA: hypothetical protein VJL37_05020 [Flavobacterium sp.]|nr:hypothetical protein [Flavobacterium sp.]
MKLIQKLAAVLFIAFAFSTASAQTGDSKNLIVNKWFIDKDAMKPVIKTMLATNPQFMGLDEATKESTLGMVMEQISGLRVEYKTDGTMLRNDANGEVPGTWSLSADGKELTTKSEGKPDKKYTLLEITKTKLNLMSSDGKNIILKTE